MGIDDDLASRIAFGAVKKAVRESAVAALVLPPDAVRRLQLQWDELKAEEGFTGEHLDWPRTRRRKLISGAPPPITPVGSRRLNWGILDGAARRPAPILGPEEAVGVEETTSLAAARFEQFAQEHFAVWSRSAPLGWEWFSEKLQSIRQAVLDELQVVWTGRGDWFLLHCHAIVSKELGNLISEWERKARQEELRRLGASPKPHNKHSAPLSASSQLGDLLGPEIVRRLEAGRLALTQQRSSPTSQMTGTVPPSSGDSQERSGEAGCTTSHPPTAREAAPEATSIGVLAPAQGAQLDNHGQETTPRIHAAGPAPRAATLDETPSVEETTRLMQEIDVMRLTDGQDGAKKTQAEISREIGFHVKSYSMAKRGQPRSLEDCRKILAYARRRGLIQ